jgi:hypothetical protein
MQNGTLWENVERGERIIKASFRSALVSSSLPGLLGSNRDSGPRQRQQQSQRQRAATEAAAGSETEAGAAEFLDAYLLELKTTLLGLHTATPIYRNIKRDQLQEGRQKSLAGRS